MARPSLKRKQSDDPPLDDDDFRPCPLPFRPGSNVYKCDFCCGMSKQRNKFLWIVKIPWVAPPWGDDPWVSRWRPGGFGWRLVDRADLSPDFVARTHRDSAVESQKYVCFLCAGTFVHGDRNHFMVNSFTGCFQAVRPFSSFPCCVDPDSSWKNHDQQSVVHSVPNRKKYTVSEVLLP